MPKEHFPCLLLLNDIHISKDNIPEFTANWQEALDICHRMDVHEIALGGDLFLSRAAQSLDVLLAVHDALLSAAESGIRVVMAEGNHDKVDQEDPRGYCHVFDQHPNVLVADDYLSLPAPEGQHFILHLISYFPEDGSFCDKLETVKKNSVGGFAYPSNCYAATESSSEQSIYSLANHYFKIKSISNGKYLLGNKAGYEAQADTADSGMTFYFKASDLGEYILFDQDSRYLTYNTFNAIVRNTTLSDKTRFKVEQYEDNSFSFYS